MIAPEHIKTETIINLISDLCEQEQGKAYSISIIKLHQIAALIRLVTGKDISSDKFNDIKDVYDLIGWDYKIKGSNINFIKSDGTFYD